MSVRQRAIIKGQLTRAARFVESVDRGTSRFDVEARYSNLKEIMGRFEDIQQKIEIELDETDSEDIRAQEIEREGFEREYFTIESKYLEWLASERDASAVAAPKVRTEANLGQVEARPKLPQINLPVFSGILTEWQTYRESFDSLVHFNDNLSPIMKFHYLRSTLRGDPLGIIGSLAITENNYEGARKLLMTRYENKRCLVQAHLKDIFDLPEVKGRSAGALRNLIDCMGRNVASLAALGEPVGMWDTILIYLITGKLDNETRRNLELGFASSSPGYSEVVSFLEQRCLALERVEPQKSKAVTSVYVGSRDRRNVGFSRMHCAFCGANEYPIFRCTEFMKLSVRARFDFTRKNNLCLNCLGNGHRAASCSFRVCAKCSKRHNVLLHFEKESVDPSSNESIVMNPCLVSKLASAEVSVDAVGLSTALETSGQVVLYTCAVLVRARDGSFIRCRALVDTGSQACFVTESLIRKLRVNPEELKVQIDGIGGRVDTVRKATELFVKPVVGRDGLTLTALVLEKITRDLPQMSLSPREIEPFMGLNLADPRWYQSGSIDILLSNTIFTKIICSGICCDSKTGLKAINTKWGWLVGGETMPALYSGLTIVSLSAAVEDRHFDIQRFWEMEELPQNFGDEVDPGELHFRKTVCRDQDGRFVVRLPFKAEGLDFSGSRELAMSRFRRLEQRFGSDRIFRNEYIKFMNEGLDGGLFESCGGEVCARSECFMPHHGVVKVSSRHTKLRCVFDGSAVAPGSCSLNSVLHTGSKQQTDLVQILLQFRSYPIAFTADIARMFCQIIVHENDRDFLRFFWREDPEKSLMILRHTRLPFGLTCSPFIAIRCIKLLTDSFCQRYPEACRILRRCMYVDDLVAGADSVELAKRRITEIVEICESAGFMFRAWVSNSKELVKTLKFVKILKKSIEFVDGDSSVLGLRWDPDADELYYDIKVFVVPGCTKRLILSQLAQFFDPMGYLSPVTVKGKLIIQELWVSGVHWDDQAPEELIKEWTKILNDIEHLNEQRVSRFVGKPSDGWLIGFSDASVKAYGACVYFVSKSGSSLIASRTRVAPLKTVSVARLELCGALMCAKLIKFVSECLNVPQDRCFCFTDSQIVLAWLAKPAYTWKTFVSNRISDIHSLLPGRRWSYVASADNPADLCSRGLYPSQLVNNKMWWTGPDWLDEFVGKVEDKHHFVTEEEARVVLAVRVYKCVSNEIITMFSGFNKILRITALILRYVSNLRKTKDARTFGKLRIEEIDKALIRLVQGVQRVHFRDTIDRLKLNKTLDRNNGLFSLAPWLDTDGTLRVGGRLRNSFLTHDEKFPIILPKRGQFVEKLINFEHAKGFHLGSSYLLPTLRRKFWIIDGRRAIERVIRRCVVCWRHRPVRALQQQGNLPRDRTVALRPFAHTGVDVCGPFLARPWRGRGRLTRKVYVVIFVCFSLRAIHLELLSDLSSDTFIAALRRFMGRRGRPLVIYSDNGTNFVGAYRSLKSWRELVMSDQFRESVSNCLLEEHIDWKFMPPRSPNFGGLWEGNIRIFKNCLFKAIGSTVLSLEEYGTLLVQIEACLNSRPLCRASESVDEMDILTPSHFLIGRVQNFLGDEDGAEIKMGARWRLLQKMLAHYWRRWTREYLSSLQSRYRNKGVQRNVEVGDVGVLVREDSPTFLWPLCRVIEVIKGSDGLVRVLNLKVGRGVLKRSIGSFCPIPDFDDSKSAGSMFKETLDI